MNKSSGHVVIKPWPLPIAMEDGNPYDQGAAALQCSILTQPSFRIKEQTFTRFYLFCSLHHDDDEELPIFARKAH